MKPYLIGLRLQISVCSNRYSFILINKHEIADNLLNIYALLGTEQVGSAQEMCQNKQSVKGDILGNFDI